MSIPCLKYLLHAFTRFFLIMSKLMFMFIYDMWSITGDLLLLLWNYSLTITITVFQVILLLLSHLLLLQ